MREIKFRGITKETNKMIYGDYNFIGDTHYITKYENKLIEDEVNYYELVPVSYIVKPETIGQYTGSKDTTKEKNELWEGDIFIHLEDEKYIIYYDNDCAMFIALPHWKSFESYQEDNEVDPTDYILWDFNCIRKIGNIYENPELLEGK